MPSSDQPRSPSRAPDAAPTFWRVPLLAAQVPETGHQVSLSADEPTRAAVAQAAGISRLDFLNADFSVTHHGRGGLRVTGTVSARVGQTCIVTLEPLDSDIREDVDLIFVPPEELRGREAEPSVKDNDADQPDDPPEVLENGGVDLGAIAVEFLVLGIDPYPRKPGVQFEVAKPEIDPADRPFAALAALKNRKNGRET